jgi:hypothetical protein
MDDITLHLTRGIPGGHSVQTGAEVMIQLLEEGIHMQLYAVFGAPCDSKAVVALYFERAGS